MLSCATCNHVPWTHFHTDLISVWLSQDHLLFQYEEEFQTLPGSLSVSMHDKEIFSPIPQMDGCVDSNSSSVSEDIFGLESLESSPPQSPVSAPHATV